IPRLQVARTVKAIDETVISRGQIGPLRPCKWIGQISKVRPLALYERGEGKHLSVRRPIDRIRRILEIRNPRSLAGVHPANVNLLLSVGVGEKRETRAVGRPPQRSVATVARGQRAVVGTVGVDDPQIGVAFVRGGVGESPYVDDFL